MFLNQSFIKFMHNYNMQKNCILIFILFHFIPEKVWFHYSVFLISNIRCNQISYKCFPCNKLDEYNLWVFPTRTWKSLQFLIKENTISFAWVPGSVLTICRRSLILLQDKAILTIYQSMPSVRYAQQRICYWNSV